MMVDIHLKLSTDRCKALFAKYFGINVCNFTAYISKNGSDDNVLAISSDEIRMKFTWEEIKEIIIDLFDNDSSKIDDVKVYIINNTEKDRDYVSIECKVSKDCVKSIVGIFE